MRRGAAIYGKPVLGRCSVQAVLVEVHQLPTTGIFHNRDDDARGLQIQLERGFEQVSVDVTGAVAVFSARGPLR